MFFKETTKSFNFEFQKFGIKLKTSNNYRKIVSTSTNDFLPLQKNFGITPAGVQNLFPLLEMPVYDRRVLFPLLEMLVYGRRALFPLLEMLVDGRRALFPILWHSHSFGSNENKQKTKLFEKKVYIINEMDYFD